MQDVHRPGSSRCSRRWARSRCPPPPERRTRRSIGSRSSPRADWRITEDCGDGTTASLRVFVEAATRTSPRTASRRLNDHSLRFGIQGGCDADFSPPALTNDATFTWSPSLQTRARRRHGHDQHGRVRSRPTSPGRATGRSRSTRTRSLPAGPLRRPPRATRSPPVGHARTARSSSNGATTGIDPHRDARGQESSRNAGARARRRGNPHKPDRECVSCPAMTRTATLLALLVAALVAVGCGGAEDDSNSATAGSRRQRRRAAEPRRVLDPRGRLRRDHPRLPEDRPRARASTFKTSFGASGEQSRAVEAGLPADVVSFSIEPDMTRLVEAGLVADDWNDSRRTTGLVTTSVVSFIVRKGNPKNIKTWDDLLKPGVEVVTPNPFTSGAAKWNLLGAYAARRPRLRREAHQGARRGPAEVRPRGAADVHRRRGRRPALLRVRGDDRAEEGRGRRVRHPRRHAEDRHHDRQDVERRRRAARAVPRLRPRRRRPSSASPTGATARSTRRCSRRTRRSSRTRRDAQDDRRPRRLVEGQRRALRP